MGDLTDTALTWLRARVPDKPAKVSDSKLQQLYDETGLVAQVALNLAESQLNTILEAGPASFNVSGVYQEDYTAVVNGLQQKIARLIKDRDSERLTIAAGIDPWAPVTEDNVGAGITQVTSGQVQRASSSWDR